VPFVVMSKSNKSSAFHPSTPIGSTLKQYCDAVFAEQPSLDEAIGGFSKHYGSGNFIKPRPTVQVEPLENDPVAVLDMPAGVSCPRFEIDLDENMFQAFLKPVEGVPFTCTPDALKDDHAMFVRPLAEFDVIGTTSIEWQRKHRTFEVLNGLIASMSHLNDGNGPNILHHGHISYLPKLMERFCHSGPVNHVTFLDKTPLTSKNVCSREFPNASLDQLPAFPYSYAFMQGTIDEFATYTHSQYAYRDSLAKAFVDGISSKELNDMIPDMADAVSKNFDDTILAPAPMSYDIYFNMHEYSVIVDKKSIDALLSILSPVGVGIMSFINESILHDPIYAAAHGYSILGKKGNTVIVCDTYTTRVYSEQRRNVNFIMNAYAYLGTAFFQVSSESYPGVELKITSDDVTYSVYGFHRQLFPLHPLPSCGELKGTLSYIDVALHQMKPLANSPTQAAYVDSYLGSCVYAPKLDGVTGFLVVKCSRNEIFVIIGQYKYICPTSFSPSGANERDLAFQIEVLSHDPTAKIISYVVVDLVTSVHSQIPFGLKWNLVQNAFKHNVESLQTYTKSWPVGGEGVVIQPLMHINADKVTLMGKTYVRSNAKYVKGYLGCDVVDFSVQCAYNSIGVDLPNKSQLYPIDGAHTLWDEDEMKFVEVQLTVEDGKLSCSMLHVRDDRCYASVGKLPQNLICYQDFRRMVIADCATNVKLPAEAFSLRYGFERFLRILHLLVQKSRKMSIDDDELMLLIGAKAMNGCDHSRYNAKCIICVTERSALEHFPSHHFSESISRFRGNIVKELH